MKLLKDDNDEMIDLDTGIHFRLSDKMIVVTNSVRLEMLSFESSEKAENIFNELYHNFRWDNGKT